MYVIPRLKVFAIWNDAVDVSCYRLTLRLYKRFFIYRQSPVILSVYCGTSSTDSGLPHVEMMFVAEGFVMFLFKLTDNIL